MDSRTILQIANKQDADSLITGVVQIVPLVDSTGFTIFLTNKAIFGDALNGTGEWLEKLTGMRMYVNDLPRCKDEFGYRVAERLMERFQPYLRDGKRMYKLAWISRTEEYKWAADLEFIPVMTWTVEEEEPVASRIKIMVPDKRVLQAVDAYVRPINRALRVHAIMRGLTFSKRKNLLRWSYSELIAKNFRNNVAPHVTAAELLEMRETERTEFGLHVSATYLEIADTMAVANALEAIPSRYAPWLEVID